MRVCLHTQQFPLKFSPTDDNQVGCALLKVYYKLMKMHFYSFALCEDCVCEWQTNTATIAAASLNTTKLIFLLTENNGLWINCIVRMHFICQWITFSVYVFLLKRRNCFVFVFVFLCVSFCFLFYHLTLWLCKLIKLIAWPHICFIVNRKSANKWALNRQYLSRKQTFS